ncbi:hypothetical protein [Yoonia sp. 208BN28-4]|uniref:hypothetical protein n=1 Tax=Yoonia sp. 208BN28-4 TaxID=3126505 RepID=UPI0030B139D4
MRHGFVYLGLLAAVSACSSSGGGTEIRRSVTADTGQTGPAPVTVTEETGTDRLLVQTDGVLFEFSEVAAYNNGTFVAARNPTAREMAVFESESDASSVVLFRPNPAPGNAPSITYSRLGMTDIPAAGSATLTGDYQAFFQSGTLAPLSYLASGDAAMVVNFTDESVAGSITNRQLRDLSDNSVLPTGGLADLTLDMATLDDAGGFSGTTTGGALTLPGFPDPAFEVLGTYSGLLAGETADEAVAGVTLTHNFGFGGMTEYGAIAAGH